MEAPPEPEPEPEPDGEWALQLVGDGVVPNDATGDLASLMREQEEAAELADAKVAEYEAERTKLLHLLHEAESDARAERAEPDRAGGDVAQIAEEDAGR